MDEKAVVLYRKPGTSADFGTRLIPFYDAYHAVSVETIGSYLAPTGYRTLSESIFVRDNTCHKEVTALHRNRLAMKKKRLLPVHSPPKSPAEQRRRLLAANLSNSNRSEVDIDHLIDSIDGNSIPQDKLLEAALQRAVNRLPASLFRDAQRHSQVLDEFVKEAAANYKTGVKRAITEYVLLNKEERMRLGMAENERLPAKSVCVTIRAPVPWHDAVKNAKKCLAGESYFLEPFLNKVRILWYQKYAHLNFLDRIQFPVDVQYFRSQVTINCQMIKFTLMYEWVSAVTSLFVEERNGLIVDLNVASRDFHLLETIATFMERLLRQLTIDNIEAWATIASPNKRELRKELFVARASFSTGMQCQLDPSPNEWPRIVVHPINEILKATETVPRIEKQLLLSETGVVGNAFKLVANVKEDDYEILQLKARLLNLVNEQDSDGMLREADNKILQFQNFKNSQQNMFDLASLRKVIRDQELFEEQSVYETDFNWAAGIMLVNYSELKKKLAAEAREAREEMIKCRVGDIIELGHKTCSTFREMKAKIEQVTGSTANLMSNMKLLNEFRAKTALLFKDIQYIQDHWTFLTEEGAQFLSDTDFELCHKLYHWPAAIRKTFATSDEHLAQAKQRTEAKLRDRIAKFERSIEDLKEKVMLFKKKRLSSPLEKTAENLKVLASLELEIEEALLVKVDMNYEEGLLGWGSLSKFVQLDNIILMKKPLDLVWKTALDFDRKSRAWLTLRLNDVNVARVTKEINLLLRRVEQTSNAMNVSDLAGDDDLKLNVATLDQRISDFKNLQLPLLAVVTLPVLRERHWDQMSALLNHRVTQSSVISLADLTQSEQAYNQGVVLKIEEIGKLATREHALEIFLARMKNEWISDDWPADALDIAANKFLEEENMEVELKELCAETFKHMHETARSFVQRKESAFLFPIKLTPPVFIELILTFKELYKKKVNAITSQKYRFKGGVDKLQLASAFVKDMKRRLIDEFQPQLIVKARETEILMIKIETDTYDVELAKEKIASDENEANRAAALAQQMCDEFTKELAEAVPAMESAIKALDTLNHDDIVFLKTMKNPPLGLKMVLEAVAILLSFAPDRRLDGNGLLADDYWSAALRMLNSADFNLLEALKNYDKDHVKPEAIKLLRDNYLSYSDFEPTILKSISIACESIAKWVRALDIYDRVINVIKPKKQKLRASEKELVSLMEGVYRMKSDLQEITDRLQGLSDEFASISKEKRDLEDNMNMSEQRVERAETLIDGLDRERERWQKVTLSLDVVEKTVAGDTLLAAAFVVYLSGMSLDDRYELMAEWQDYLKTKPLLQYSTPFNLVDIAGAPLDIQTWILAGLQTDRFCMDNATIATNSRRFPFIIDPMNVASDWITRLYQNRGLIIITGEDKLEEVIIGQIKKNVIRGKPILIENIDAAKFANPFMAKLLAKDVESEDGLKYINICGEDIEYSSQFQLFMTSKEYIDIPRHIYSHICVLNWFDIEHSNRQRIVSVEDTIRYKERAKKEKTLIELEDKLLESLSSSDIDALDDENAVHLLMSYKNLAAELDRDKLTEMESAKEEDES